MEKLNLIKQVNENENIDETSKRSAYHESIKTDLNKRN